MNINGVILIGPPGSGKSTIGKAIANKLNMCYVSSGDIAREIAERDKETRNSLAVGGMANEDRMRQAIFGTLYEINAANREFVLDGFPRFLDQYEWLVRKFPNILEYVVDVPTDVCIDRLIMRNRPDDTDEAIANRMDYYRMNTLPMIFQIPRTYIVSNCGRTDRIISEMIYDIRTKTGSES